MKNLLKSVHKKTKDTTNKIKSLYEVGYSVNPRFMLTIVGSSLLQLLEDGSAELRQVVGHTRRDEITVHHNCSVLVGAPVVAELLYAKQIVLQYALYTSREDTFRTMPCALS